MFRPILLVIPSLGCTLLPKMKIPKGDVFFMYSFQKCKEILPTNYSKAHTKMKFPYRTLRALY